MSAPASAVTLIIPSKVLADVLSVPDGVEALNAKVGLDLNIVIEFPVASPPVASGADIAAVSREDASLDDDGDAFAGVGQARWQERPTIDEGRVDLDQIGAGLDQLAADVTEAGAVPGAQPLVPGAGQGVDAAALHVHRERPDGLAGADDEVARARAILLGQLRSPLIYIILAAWMAACAPLGAVTGNTCIQFSMRGAVKSHGCEESVLYNQGSAVMTVISMSSSLL